jgi:hypothetical protein
VLLFNFFILIRWLSIPSEYDFRWTSNLFQKSKLKALSRIRTRTLAVLKISSHINTDVMLQAEGSAFGSRWGHWIFQLT